MSGWERVEREQGQLLARTADPAFWRTFLQDHPEVLHQLVADLYRASAGTKERPATLEDLWGLVNPTFSNEPFGDAVRGLLKGRSIRWLAQQLHVDHTVVLRALNGERGVVNLQDPRRSMLRMEAIARVLKVHPSYFREWRRLWIMSLLDSAFEERPHLSIGVYRKFACHEERRASRSERTLRS